MSLNKEQLLAIHGLTLADAVSKMSNDQFDEYCKSLIAFTETFPTLETKLKNLFEAKEYETFSKSLFLIQNMLERIHAPNMANSCKRLLDELSKLNPQKYNIVEAHLTYLLAEISSLSIDIQMAHLASEQPAKEGEKPEELPQDASAPLEEGAKKIILAVDDVSFLLMGLKSILQDTQYKFVGVNSGEIALRYVEKYTPDLFILDIEMPEMNGYELASKLRRCGQRAPIIFLTGNSKKDYVRKAIEMGAADFIIKPVNKEQVLEKIKKHLG